MLLIIIIILIILLYLLVIYSWDNNYNDKKIKKTIPKSNLNEYNILVTDDKKYVAVNYNNCLYLSNDINNAEIFFINRINNNKCYIVSLNTGNKIGLSYNDIYLSDCNVNIKYGNVCNSIMLKRKNNNFYIKFLDNGEFMCRDQNDLLFSSKNKKKITLFSLKKIKFS